MAEDNKFVLSGSGRRGHAPQQDNKIKGFGGQMDSMKNFVGPAFILCIIL
jgi:hypothetical protein